MSRDALPQEVRRHYNSTSKTRRRRLLDMVGAVETEPEMIGASAHILAVGRKR